MMADREALIHAIELREKNKKRDHHGFVDFTFEMVGNVLAMLKEQQQQIWELQDQVEYLTDKRKEQEGLLGIQQTADGITFVSTGTAQQGEARGLLLGKFAMQEKLKKELLYRGLLTDDIRAVFDEAKQQEGR